MRRLFLFLILFFSSWTSWLYACEGCKMAVTNGLHEPQTLRAGFALSWSVLFLLLVLFLLGALLSWAIYSACRQSEEWHRSHS